MKKTVITAALFTALFVGIAVFQLPAQQLSAEELLEKAERVIAPEKYYSKVSLHTEKPGERDKTMVMETYYKRGTGTYIEVIEPARSKGMRFLQKEENLWMFNPRSNSRRAIRLSPRESFQGSIFSNSDVGDPQYTDDYDTVYGEEEIINHPDGGETPCFVLIGTAKHPKAPYGKIKMWVEKETLIPLEIEYYAKSGLLFKKMTLSDIKQLAGRERPTRFRMESLEQKGAYSTMIIETMELRDDIPARMFSQHALTR